MTTRHFSAPDADLADIAVHGYADEHNPNVAKYLLIAKTPASLTFHPLLIIRAQTSSPVCLLSPSFRLASPQNVRNQSIEAKLHTALAGYALPAYSIDTEYPLRDVSQGKVSLDLTGYPQAETVNKLFYSMRNMRKQHN